MKFRKIISCLLAAVMCAAMFAVSVSADETAAETATEAAQHDYWKEAKELGGAKYYPSLMKLTEKYYAKEATHTITYGKSMTKKMADKLAKASDGDDPQYRMAFCDGESVFSFVVKGSDSMLVIGGKDMILVTYTEPDKTTMVSGSDGGNIYSVFDPESEGDDASEADESFESEMGLTSEGIDNNMKGKYFKIKYKEKIYIYEEFDGAGTLFTEKGTPVATIDEDGCASLRISYSVKDSDVKFTAPEGYKYVEPEEFNAE